MFTLDRSPLPLSADAIRQANASSLFGAGDILAREANAAYLAGLSKMFDEVTDPTPEQEEKIALYASEWRNLCTDGYNKQLAHRAAWKEESEPSTLPDLTVHLVRIASGHPSWNTHANKQRAEFAMQESVRFESDCWGYIVTIRGFLRLPGFCEKSGVYDLVIGGYRSGRSHGPVSADDYVAVEKLTARLEYLREQHEHFKSANAYFRKHGTMQGFPGMTYDLTVKLDTDAANHRPMNRAPYSTELVKNTRASIRHLEQRLNELQASGSPVS